MTTEHARLVLEHVGLHVQPQANGFFIRPVAAPDGRLAPPDAELAHGQVLTEAAMIRLAETVFQLYERFLTAPAERQHARQAGR